MAYPIHPNGVVVGPNSKMPFVQRTCRILPIRRIQVYLDVAKIFVLVGRVEHNVVTNDRPRKLRWLIEIHLIRRPVPLN